MRIKLSVLLSITPEENETHWKSHPNSIHHSVWSQLGSCLIFPCVYRLMKRSLILHSIQDKCAQFTPGNIFQGYDPQDTMQKNRMSCHAPFYDVPVGPAFNQVKKSQYPWGSTLNFCLDLSKGDAWRKNKTVQKHTISMYLKRCKCSVLLTRQSRS